MAVLPRPSAALWRRTSATPEWQQQSITLAATLPRKPHPSWTPETMAAEGCCEYGSSTRPVTRHAVDRKHDKTHDKTHMRRVLVLEVQQPGSGSIWKQHTCSVRLVSKRRWLRPGIGCHRTVHVWELQDDVQDDDDENTGP